MKRLILSIFAGLLSLHICAQITGDGYYRVSNYKTGRYAYVTDNTGSINVQATTAEMGAIQLWTDHSRTYSDPASVIYVEKKGSNSGGDYYDLQSQGTSTYSIIGYYLYAHFSGGFYQVYAEGKYLSDDNYGTGPQGSMGTKRNGDYRKWIVSRIDNQDEFFGITPSIETGGRKFHPFYADFGFSCLSDGMKVWYISEVDSDGVVIKEFTGDTVPARTPVIIECSSSDPSLNRIDLIKDYTAGPADNKLKGVYFNNPQRTKSQDARTVFDPATMRVLGVMANGSLGYVLSDVQPDADTHKQSLLANQSYLPVGEGIPNSVPIITEAEYQALLARRADSIAAIVASVNVAVSATPLNKVYQISGRFVGELTAEEIEMLPAGVYIIGKRKVVIDR